MPRLLFHGEPSCETRLPGTRVGDCIVVYDDGQDSGLWRCLAVNKGFAA